MIKSYTVGRSAEALIRIPKQHDTVGKLHLRLEDLGKGLVTITDLNSTNGTFLRVAGKWEELKAPRTVNVEAEIMLGSHITTPLRLLSSIPAPMAPSDPPKAKRTAKAAPPPPLPPQPPPRKSPGMRRNEFGEIVPE
jgi:hypothetical protein